MNKLPLLISVPHAGLLVPPEVSDLNQLTSQEIAEDGDLGAREIYAPLADRALAFVTSDIARAFVDLNRAEDDIRKDGVIKTHTCWDRPIYRRPLPPELVERLLEGYYRPYHRRLSALAASGVIAGVDCHTMASRAPPEAPDPGCMRPAVCVGDAKGACPSDWSHALAECFRARFQGEVTLNQPFSGGFITRRHASEIPWVQLELNRGASDSLAAQAEAVLRALSDWIAVISP